MPTISGTVYDELGNRAGDRLIRFYRRDTGALIGQSLSKGGILPFNDNPIAKFSMDVINGSTIPDDTGNYSATAYNSPNLMPGVIGNCISLNGTNQYLSLNVKNNVTYNAANGGFAISFWCYRFRDNKENSIFVKANDPTNVNKNNRLVLHLPWNNQEFYFDFGNQSLSRVLGNWNPAFYENWIHIVAQYTTNNKNQLWINGSLIGERDCSSNPQSIVLGDDILVGYYEFSSQYTKAMVDQFRIFGRELSPFEIAILSSENTILQVANTGDFSFTTSYTGECDVLFLDNPSGTVLNDIVYRVNII